MIFHCYVSSPEVHFLPLRLDGCLQVPLDGLDATAEPYSPPQPKMRPLRGEMPSFCWWNLWNPHVWWNSRNSTAKVTLWVELAIFGWKPGYCGGSFPLQGQCCHWNRQTWQRWWVNLRWSKDTQSRCGTGTSMELPWDEWPTEVECQNVLNF